MKNNYLSNFIDLCIKSFLDKLYTPKLLFRMYLKEIFLLSLPFLGSTSLQIRKKLQKLFSDKLTSCNLKTVFTPPVGVKSFFTIKDKLPKCCFHNLLTSISVVASVLLIMVVRICEHLGISHLTGTKVKIENNYAIQEHLLCCNY